MAGEFQIEGRPILVDMQGRGSIEYDEKRKKFCIYLSNRNMVGGVTSDKTRRFVYAHEFAHRFLFVRWKDGWVRALSRVADSVEQRRRLSVVRALSRVEEGICNDVAGRILVPEEHLRTVVARVIGEGGLEESSLIRLVSVVSQRYQVSWWCAVRRLAVGKTLGVAEVLKGPYLLLLLGRSGQTGRGRGQVALRVLDLWWPNEVDGVRVRAVYPGMRVAHLGREFEERVCAVEGRRRRELVCEVRLLSRRGAEIRAMVRGFSQRWGSGRDGRVVVYGRVSMGSSAGEKDAGKPWHSVQTGSQGGASSRAAGVSTTH